MPLSTSRSVPGGMPTTAKASPRSSAARASASVSARTATLTAPLASRVCDDAAAQLAQVVVDDRDRDLAQNLVEIGLRVIDAVDQRRQHQQDEGAADREHAPPLGGEGSADAARRGRRCCRLRRGRCAGRASSRSRAAAGTRAARRARRAQRARRTGARSRRAAARAPPVRAAPPCTSAAAGSRPRPAQTRSCPGSEIPRRHSRTRARRRDR